MREQAPIGEGGMNFKAMLKHGGWMQGGESYVFVYDDMDASRAKLLELLPQLAADPELSFSEDDANLIAELVEPREIPGLTEARDLFFHQLEELSQ